MWKRLKQKLDFQLLILTCFYQEYAPFLLILVVTVTHVVQVYNYYVGKGFACILLRTSLNLVYVIYHAKSHFMRLLLYISLIAYIICFILTTLIFTTNLVDRTFAFTILLATFLVSFVNYSHLATPPEYSWGESIDINIQ